MTERLHRGKRKDNGEWVEGENILIVKTENGKRAYIAQTGTQTAIFESEEHSDVFVATPAFSRVIPETVGQYTGLTDKNGKKIFEGDIVKGNEEIFTEDIIFTVVFDEYCRYMIVSSYGHYLLARNHKDVEVIGNIHDNPELLKGGAEE